MSCSSNSWLWKHYVSYPISDSIPGMLCKYCVKRDIKGNVLARPVHYGNRRDHLEQVHGVKQNTDDSKLPPVIPLPKSSAPLRFEAVLPEMELWVRFLTTTPSPLNILNHPSLAQLLRSPPPTPAAARKAVLASAEAVRAATCCGDYHVSFDGWSNWAREYVAVVRHDSAGPHLLAFVETGGTAAQLASVVSASLPASGRLLSVLTDGAAAAQAAAALVAAPHGAPVRRCLTHHVQLAAAVLLASVPSQLLRRVAALARRARFPKLAKELENEGLPRMPTPARTRWLTWAATLRYLGAHEDAVRRACVAVRHDTLANAEMAALRSLLAGLEELDKLSMAAATDSLGSRGRFCIALINFFEGTVIDVSDTDDFDDSYAPSEGSVPGSESDDDLSGDIAAAEVKLLNAMTPDVMVGRARCALRRKGMAVTSDLLWAGVLNPHHKLVARGYARVNGIPLPCGPWDNVESLGAPEGIGASAKYAAAGAVHTAASDLERYMQEPVAEGDLLEYWRRSPLASLRSAGVEAATAPASSVACERAFSHARHLLPYTRNRMSAALISALMVVGAAHRADPARRLYLPTSSPAAAPAAAPPAAQFADDAPAPAPDPTFATTPAPKATQSPAVGPAVAKTPAPKATQSPAVTVAKTPAPRTTQSPAAKRANCPAKRPRKSARVVEDTVSLSSETSRRRGRASSDSDTVL